MMNRVAIAALLAVAATPAAAQDVSIAAGDHPGYSRVVVPAGSGPVSVTEAERAVGLHFGSADLAFDLTAINTGRRAKRVASATAVSTGAGPVVRLALGCDCRVRQSRLPDGRLVIDIFDPPANQTPVATTSAAQAREAAPQAAAPAPAQHGPIQLAPAVAEQAAAPGAQPTKELSVDEARQRMLTLLQQAANDGLLTVKDDAHELTKPAPLLPVSANGARESAPQPMFSCLPDAAFAIDGAPFETDPLVAISERQSALANAEVGEEAPIVEALAAGYLAIGFGDEALAPLAEYGAGNALIADMARIVADREIEPTSIIVAADDCRGAHALWQAAATTGERASIAARRSDKAAFDLPRRLRTILATRIARKMIDAEDWSEARRFHGIAREASPSDTEELKFIAAALLDHDGGGKEAEAALLDIAATNTEASKDALLALAERYDETGETPPDGFVDEIGALAKTEKGSVRGGEAALREAMLWAREGNVEAALMLLVNAAESDPSAATLAAERGRDLILGMLSADDPAMRAAALSAYLDNRAFIDSSADSARVATIAASTAAALGVPNLAVELAPAKAANEADAMTRAKALLAAGAPDRALETAAPYADDPEFTAIVVDANLDLGRDFAALAAASAIRDPQEKAARMADAAWRAGDFASAARAFHKIDPSGMNAQDARRFALAAYMAGEKTFPEAAGAVLREASDPALAGLEALFGADSDGSIVDRGKASTRQADENLKFIEEMLAHG